MINEEDEMKLRIHDLMKNYNERLKTENADFRRRLKSIKEVSKKWENEMSAYRTASDISAPYSTRLMIWEFWQAIKMV